MGESEGCSRVRPSSFSSKVSIGLRHRYRRSSMIQNCRCPTSTASDASQDLSGSKNTMIQRMKGQQSEMHCRRVANCDEAEVLNGSWEGAKSNSSRTYDLPRMVGRPALGFHLLFVEGNDTSHFHRYITLPVPAVQYHPIALEFS